MNIDQIINDFLRDAQWRCAEIRAEMDVLEDAGGYNYVSKRDALMRIENWINVIWYSRIDLVESDGDGNIISDTPYNFLSVEWTDDEIIQECSYLRYEYDMNPVPWLDFAGYNPIVISGQSSYTTGNSVNGAVFPSGTEGQYLVYNAGGTVVAASFPIEGGMLPGETIFDYFA